MPFLITILAGLSSMIGYLFIYLKNDNDRLVVFSLSFASGVMFFISIFDLLPESFMLINDTYYSLFTFLLCLLFIIIGFILSSIIDNIKLKNNDSLYHIGIVSMIALIIHNIPEGMITYLASSYDLKFGLSLAIAISLHNIPEGISISIPIYYSTGSKLKAFIYTFISGISEFIGAIITCIFFTSYSSLFLGFLYSLITGIMFYISIFDLLITSFKYRYYFRSIFFFVVGVFFIYLSILLLH